MRLKLNPLSSGLIPGIFTSLVALALLSPFDACADRKRPLRSVRCPPVIGDTRSGIALRAQRKNSFYQCFRNSRAARKRGFSSLQTALERNNTGWYRVRLLTVIRDTCQEAPALTGPTLFLEIRETNGVVAGQFCPSFGSYRGAKANDGSGFTVSGTRYITEGALQTLCDDRRVQEDQQIRLTSAVIDGAAFSVELKIVKSCVSQLSGSRACSREYSGIAFFETAHPWPQIPENLNLLEVGCTEALSHCQDCHQELAD